MANHLTTALSPAITHSNVIGFLFPAYYSFKAIESPNKEDDKQWYECGGRGHAGEGELVGKCAISRNERDDREERGDVSALGFGA